MKTWAGVTIGVVAFLGVCVLAVGGVGVCVFFQHVDIDDASASAADRSFDEARARFVGETPLQRLSDHEWSVNRRPTGSNTKLRTLHVMAWETDGEAALRDLDLTVADLDRHGPGLIIDYDAPRDGRVLVWAE